MSVIGFFSLKGAPGVTTLATALARHASGAVFIEADAAGGDLVLQHGISQSPGLAQFAARARRVPETERDALDGLIRPIERGGFDLVPAPVEPQAASAALAALAASPNALAEAGRGRALIVDFGRLGPHSPAFGLTQACDLLALVVRGDVASLGHARESTWLPEIPGRTGFVLVDTGPYRAKEAAEVLSEPFLGAVPFSRKRLDGRRNARAVDAVWRELSTRLHEPATAHAVAQVNTR